MVGEEVPCPVTATSVAAMLRGSGNQPICVPALASKAERMPAAKLCQSRVADGRKNAMKPSDPGSTQLLLVRLKVGSVREASWNRKATRAFAGTSAR